MGMDIDLIKQTLCRLGQRDWPQEWGAAEEASNGDFLGWCHRYQLEEPLEASALNAFEERFGVNLPQDYRQFLTELGNGGAGPGYGIFPLGESETEPLPQDVLQALGTNFGLTDSWNDTSLLDQPEVYYGYALMAGAVPVATEGSALDYWLIISGPQSGQVWFDKRTDNEGVAPVTNEAGQIMSFAEWYQVWLMDAAKRHG